MEKLVHVLENKHNIVVPLFGAPNKCTIISSVGSQNLVTLIFTKTTFVNAGIPNAWRTFCQILVALDQLEPPLKHQSCFKIFYL